MSELHGYNLEGQHDIDELNKSGQLDLEVRRIQAGEEAKKKAEADTYGTVKLLRDTNGDGTMDEAVVWADRLPPCYGLVPANGGIVIACAPDIVFLKDTDGDDRPDARENPLHGLRHRRARARHQRPDLGTGRMDLLRTRLAGRHHHRSPPRQTRRPARERLPHPCRRHRDRTGQRQHAHLRMTFTGKATDSSPRRHIPVSS